MLKRYKKSDTVYLHDLGLTWMRRDVWNKLMAYWTTTR